MQYGNKLAWYEANEKLIEQQHDIQVQARHKEGAEAGAKALQQQRDATAAEYLVTLLQDLDKAQTQANQNRADLAKAEERLRLEVLRAPIDGTVQQVSVHTIGGVVTPAEQLMAIVPDKDGLVVEAMVENKDVGFVRPGQTARVKIDTFNFTRYGLIDGKVIGLTRDTVESQGDHAQPDGKDAGAAKPDSASKEPSYVARIALSRDWMLTEGGRVALGPGMAVTAEIQTGRRRIISYLLSPLVRHVEESGHER
jgi:hemolysin D